MSGAEAACDSMNGINGRKKEIFKLEGKQKVYM
jgi:hypothetical protein